MKSLDLAVKLLGFKISDLQSITSIKLYFIHGFEVFLLLLIILLPLLIFILNFKENRPIHRRINILITTLRIAFIIIVALLLSGLSITISGTVPDKNKIAVLFDTSKSMSIIEGNQTRFDRIIQSVRATNFLNILEEKTSIKPSTFSFSSSVSPITHDEILQASIKPEGLSTNISKAISEVITNLGSNNLIGIVLFTDGCHNIGENPVEIISKNTPPIYIAYSGLTNKPLDLAISLDRPPSIGFLNSSVNVKGIIKVSNFDINLNKSNKINLNIIKDDKSIKTLSFTISSASEIIPFEYKIPCYSEGTYKYTFAISTFSNELTHDNNESKFVLKVVKEKIKILAISNIISYDLAFMRWALRSDASFNYNSYTLVSENRWIEMKDFILNQSPIANPDFLKALEDVDILLLAGINYKFIKNLVKEIINRIESGKLNLLLLPSNKGFKPLNYANTELANILPMDIMSEEWNSFPSSISLISDQPQYMFLRLFEDINENVLFFKTIPKIEAVCSYNTYKPAAEFLLVSSFEKNGQKVPILISHKFGRGKVLVFCGGPMWPMGFSNVTTEKTIKPYKAFIVNMFKWLSDRKEDTNVALELPSGRIFTDQPVIIKVSIFDDRQKPIKNAMITANIINDNNKSSLTFSPSNEEGSYEATFIPNSKGTYKIYVNAKYQGKDIGKAESEFIVETPTIEYENTEINLDLLNKIASITNGICVPVDKCDIIVNNLKTSGSYKVISKSFELKDSWLIFVAVLCLPLLEWFLRRTNGLN